MKKYYTQLFLILVFTGIAGKVFSEVLVRQDGVLEIPVAPVNVTAEPLSASEISVNWEYDDSEEKVNHFFVERAEDPSAQSFEEIARVNKHERSVIDENLLPSTTYRYRVVAGNADGDSEPSNEAEATTSLISPTPPAGLTAVGIDASTIRLTWTHDMVNVEKFVIERDGLFGFQQIIEVPASVTSYDDGGLLPLISYSYRVKAVMGLEESDYSNIASGTTALLPTVPAAPTNLTASTVTSSSIVLSWEDNADNEDKYVLEKASTVAGPFEETVLPSDTETHTDTDVTANSTYFYQVKATNEVGSSDYSATIETSTLDVAPAAPSALTVSPVSSTVISVQWTDNSDNETGFVLESSPTSAAADFVPLAITAANVINYDHDGLTPNTSYYYRVKATNIIGDSDYTDAALATTLDVAPEAPTDFQITANTATGITLAWTDNSTNETGFVLEVSTTSTTTGFEPLSTTAANIATYEASGLTPNTTYYFRLKAINAVGESTPLTVTGKTDDVVPEAPSELLISGKTATTITLGWKDNSPNETAFVVEKSLTSASTGFTELTTTAANATSFEDTDLSPNTTYYYRVKAVNTAGESIYSSVSGKTDDVAPAAPTGLQTSGITANSITLSWTDKSNNEVDFEIERSETSASTGFTALTSVPANTTTYTDTEVVSNTTYYYRVRATNAVGESVFSATASGKTPVDLPATPINLTVGEVTTSTIALSWTDVSTNETGFEIVRSLDNSNFTQIAELPANNTSFVDVGLKSNTTYFYRVRAVNKDGASPLGNLASFTTEREAGPPAAPSLLKATAITTFQINLTWQDNADNETSYIVERGLEVSGTFTVVATLPANTEFYENTGLDPGKTYYYRVIAKNIDGEVVSTIATATTLANPTPPKAPSGLSATAVSTVQINLTWIDNSNSETNFTIQRSETLNGTFQFVASVGANVTSYQNFGLKANTTYYYRVRAESGDGVSDYSLTDNAKTPDVAKPPTAPSSLTAEGVSTIQINLEWIDNSNSETNFVIERSNTNDGPFSFIAAVGPNITRYQNTGLSANTRYFYRVMAINNDGTSDFTDTASASTPIAGKAPIPPSNLVAIGVSTTQINLTWVDNSENETNFAIYRSSSPQGPFTFLVSLPANQVTYENTGLEPNTTYHYQVRASNIDGNSLFSSVTAGTTSEEPQPPAAPDGLTALAVSTTQITLKWNDKAFNETVYEIERFTDEKFTTVGTVGANDTVFQNFGLDPNTEYRYRVRAQNGDGVSAYSNEVAAITLENNVPPLAPSNLFIKTISQSEVELFWTDNSDNEEEFNVERAELETEEQAAKFVIVEELPSNTNYFVDDGLKPNTIYRYRIQAKNSDGESYSNEYTVITSVGGNPIIATLSRNYPKFFSDQVEDTIVSIEIAEPELYESVLFYYRGLNEGEYKSDIPVAIDGNKYAVTITKDQLDEMGIEYYFEAMDAEDNAAVSTKGYTYRKFEAPGLSLPTLKFGETVSDYQMISIPLKADQIYKTTVEVLEDDLGPYNPSKWRLFHFNNGSMLERGAFIDMEPGKSYWLIVKEKDTINTGAGNVVEAHSGAPAKLKLNVGWNQIGNPYMFDISWNEVVLANSGLDILGPLVKYDGTYVETQSLGIFEGAYVHSDEETTIVFPIGVQEGGTSGRITTAESGKFGNEQDGNSGWNVDFSLVGNGLVYHLAGLGMHSEASQSKDRFDRIALPKLPAYLDINFSHPEYFSPEFTKDIVPLQESYIWDMKLVSSFGDGPVTISWEKADHLPEDMNLVLFDPVRQKQVDMKSAEKYVVSGESALQVYYGDDEFIAKNLKPDAIYLGAAYPNPFRETFTIPVSLPESNVPYTIRIALYNNVGKQVAEPFDFPLEGGFIDIELPGEDLQKLNDGLYFYKVKVIQEGNSLKEEAGRLIKR